MNPADALASPPALVREADRFELRRCRCPVCERLDRRYPGEGFQLALFSYAAPPRRSVVVVRLAEARARRDARAGK